LASERGIDVNNPANGYPFGYSKKQSGSFIAGLLAAYSGSDVRCFIRFSEASHPNWAVKYSGLMRYGLFKRNFKRFSLQHIIGFLTQSINIDLILIMIKPLMG
jgi:cell surface protein SprA